MAPTNRTYQYDGKEVKKSQYYTLIKKEKKRRALDEGEQVRKVCKIILKQFHFPLSDK